MKYSFLRVICPSLVLAVVLGYIGCTAGTNTGNGTAAGTGGVSGFCYWEPCGYPVNVIGSDGTTYRGKIQIDQSVTPNVNIAIESDAASVSNPPVAELSFTGGEVDLSDAGCQDTDRETRFYVDIYISAADSSIDASGALHVRSPGRDDIYASGPGDINDLPVPGWAVDLTVTADGQLTATLSVTSSSPSDAGADMLQLNFNGPVGGCVADPDGGVMPATIPVSGGRTFSFPCPRSTFRCF